MDELRIASYQSRDGKIVEVYKYGAAERKDHDQMYRRIALESPEQPIEKGKTGIDVVNEFQLQRLDFQNRKIFVENAGAVT